MLISCSIPKTYKHTFKCENKTKEKLFSEVSVILANEGLTIKLANEGSGTIQAERESTTVSMDFVSKWNITIMNDTLIAYATKTIISKNAFGKETGRDVTHVNSDESEATSFYWNVREKLENLCGAKVIISELEYSTGAKARSLSK